MTSLEETWADRTWNPAVSADRHQCEDPTVDDCKDRPHTGGYASARDLRSGFPVLTLTVAKTSRGMLCAVVQ